jgi:hypothetical protein
MSVLPKVLAARWSEYFTAWMGRSHVPAHSLTCPPKERLNRVEPCGPGRPGVRCPSSARVCRGIWDAGVMSWRATDLYLEATLAAHGLALVRDPFFDPNCWANCTDNVFLLRSLPGLAREIESADRWFIAAAAIASVLVIAWRLLTDSSPARRALLPFILPATLLAGAVLAHSVVLHSTSLEDPSQSAFQSIFIVECAAVILLAAGLGWAAVRLRLQRRAVAQITANVGQAPPPGSVQVALARAVGDPELQIAYRLTDFQRYVDAGGRPVREPVDAPGRTLTPLVRDGQKIAIVTHTAAVPGLERAIGAAVRLALENERLQAETLAQLDQLRVSRVRVVETGDDERRQLERRPPRRRPASAAGTLIRPAARPCPGTSRW